MNFIKDQQLTYICDKLCQHKSVSEKKECVKNVKCEWVKAIESIIFNTAQEILNMTSNSKKIVRCVELMDKEL